MEVGRTDYEKLIQPLLDKTMDCVQKALDDAHLTATAINKVVLVGGSTRTPRVSQMLEERLGQPPHQEVNPDLCVAMGAAIQGAIIAGSNVGAVLVDITPHSLGIKCVDINMGMEFNYRFVPIIHRNTPLPASRSELFHTYHDGQRTVEIDVYQGESDDVRHNHRVGKFSVEGLADVAAGNPLTVQLDLNLDGILKVSAKEKATGLQKQVTIENALAAYEREEQPGARERLDRLWNEREDDFEEDEDEYVGEETGVGDPNAVPELVPGPREGQREAVQARALLEKAERLMTKVLPDDRPEIERQMTAVRNGMTDRKWDEVTRSCNELADTLFYLEDA
jgi:molecular chaperone DnaK